MTDFLEQWTHQSEEHARLVAQERLIVAATEAIWKAMEEAGINKAELANRMAATKGYISQVLSGSRNMTLRTLSDICFVLGKKPVITLEAQDNNEAWQTEQTHDVRALKGMVRKPREPVSVEDMSAAKRGRRGDKAKPTNGRQA